MVLDRNDDNATEEIDEFDPSSVPRRRWRAYEEGFQDEPDHMIKGDKMRNELDDGRKSYNIKYTHNLSQYSVSPSAISQGHSVHSIPVVLPWNSNDTSAVTSDRINNTHSPTNEEIMF
jgi:hypothetical protein